MITKGWVVVLVAVWTSLSSASDTVQVSTTIEPPAESELALGESLLISLYLQSANETPLFGAELEILVATADLSIRSLDFDPAFSTALTQSATAEDVSTNGAIEAAQVQPLGSINPTLGADGAPVHFATVELQVLTDGPFESGLIVRARGALVGEIPESTVVLGNPSGEDGWGEGRIEIVNTGEQGTPTESGSSTGSGEQNAGAEGPGGQGSEGGTEGERGGEGEGEAIERADWTVTQGPASLEIRPVDAPSTGSGEPVTTLAPNTEYEVHYVVGTEGQAVNGFDLIVTWSEGNWEQGTGNSDPAAPGFDLCWAGAEVTELPADAESGRPRVGVSADALGPSTGSGTGPSTGSGTGHICNFITGPAGWIDLELRLYHTDPATFTVVEMFATAEYAVE